MMRLLLLLLVVLLIVPSFSASTVNGIRVIDKEGRGLNLYKDYYALVVGISDYEKWPKLPNPVNDAREVAAKLKDLGFQVRMVLDPTTQEIKAALNDLVYETGRDEQRAILIYYAGHGETEDLADGTKMGYIIPKDCPLLKKDPKGFATHAVSMRDIESVSLRIQSKHVLMLFDSCFSGSLFNLVRAVPDDISEKSALPVRQYITAGRQDEPVPDASMFKRCLLIGLDGDADLTGDGYITGSELGMYLSERVVNYTQRQQHPQYGKINNPNLDRGDFIFVPSKARQKEEELQWKIEERAAVTEELDRLRKEMKKNQTDIEQMKHHLEATAAKEKASVNRVELEKKTLEEELKRLKSEMERASQTIKDLQSKQSEEKAGAKEAPGKRALEAELDRLKSEMDLASSTIKELQSKQAPKEKLAYIPETPQRRLQEWLKSGQGPFLIDNFESKDLWSKNLDDKWKTYHNGQAGINISIDQTQGANATSSSMKMEGELSDKNSGFGVSIGGGRAERISEVETDRSAAYDLSRFNKITFYLKGAKKKTIFSTPNGLLVLIYCYDENVRNREGKFAAYYNKTVIRPSNEWRKIEIPFSDFVPTARMRTYAVNYPEKPAFQNVLYLNLGFSSYASDGGNPGSNTVWIDEIMLE
jgi:uncharacterized caspase-like protein